MPMLPISHFAKTTTISCLSIGGSEHSSYSLAESSTRTFLCIEFSMSMYKPSLVFQSRQISTIWFTFVSRTRSNSYAVRKSDSHLLCCSQSFVILLLTYAGIPSWQWFVSEATRVQFHFTIIRRSVVCHCCFRPDYFSTDPATKYSLLMEPESEDETVRSYSHVEAVLIVITRCVFGLQWLSSTLYYRWSWWCRWLSIDVLFKVVVLCWHRISQFSSCFELVSFVTGQAALSCPVSFAIGCSIIRYFVAYMCTTSWLTKPCMCVGCLVCHQKSQSPRLNISSFPRCSGAVCVCLCVCMCVFVRSSQAVLSCPVRIVCPCVSISQSVAKRRRVTGKSSPWPASVWWSCDLCLKTKRSRICRCVGRRAHP